MIKLIFLFSVLLSLTACVITKPNLGNDNSDAIIKALNADASSNKKIGKKRPPKIPDAVKRALLPNLDNGALGSSTGVEEQQRFNIVANNVPAKDFYMGLVKGTKYNMIVNPQIGGMISLDLKDVTLDEVMDSTRDIYGFEYRRTADGYQVLPRQLSNRIFVVNYLNIDRDGHSATSLGSGELTQTNSQLSGATWSSASSQQQVTESASVSTTSKTKFWNELKENLISIIGDKDGRKVVINPQSGVIDVRAYPDELRNIADYLDDIQNNMNRQVIIEAQVLEVQLDAGYQTGINWKLLDWHQGANSTGKLNPIGTPAITNIPSNFSNITTLTISSGWSFDSFIQLLSTQGKVNVLSTPRVSTTNNQKAVIKVGNERFFVTNVSSNSVTGTSTTQTQNIQLTPFFSGIALDVTPQITQSGEVTLHIHPIVSNVTLDRQIFQVNGQNQDLPLAQSTVRESDSIVHARSGQVIVIGGLMQNNSNSTEARTPGTEHLGPLSGLFKSSNKSATKFELVILLRPTVTGVNYNWNKELHREADKYRSMRGEFRYTIVPTEYKHSI